MALDKGTRNILIVGVIIGLGGLAYWYFRRTKKTFDNLGDGLKEEDREDVSLTDLINQSVNQN